MKKENLSKITLNKEEIVNLNPQEMGDLKGGSSIPCGSIIATSIIESIRLSYDISRDSSWCLCPTPPPCECGNCSDNTDGCDCCD